MKTGPNCCRVLDQELARLPDKYRTALVLCELEGRPRKEAARQLGIPEGTLSSRLATGRRMLAKRFGRPGFGVVGRSAGGLGGCVADAVGFHGQGRYHWSRRVRRPSPAWSRFESPPLRKEWSKRCSLAKSRSARLCLRWSASWRPGPAAADLLRRGGRSEAAERRPSPPFNQGKQCG